MSDPVMYSQLQPWSVVGAPPCMEQVSGPPLAARVSAFYRTSRPHPWRPTLGYENVQVTPLPSQPVTNAMMDPCYTPHGMATEPLHYPNLVTGFERNPGHAARAALYTRYTPYEWCQYTVHMLTEADSNRKAAQDLRTDFLMRSSDELVAQGQRESGRRLGERVTDTTFWRNEASLELDRLLTENIKLQDNRRDLEKAIQDIELPMHIAQECLYHRENRTGIDLVHDQAEVALLREVETLKNVLDKLKALHEKVSGQFSHSRAVQQELEKDVKSKEGALGIDTLCFQMNNFSRGINFYGGIEKYDPSWNDTKGWAENSNGIIMRSRNERNKTAQMRVDSENLISACAEEVCNAWIATNNALTSRSWETMEEKNKLQLELQKIQKEIFAIEKYIELVRKSINDKSQPLKVAHTRLEARTHRKGVELTRDEAQNSLVTEVVNLGGTIDKLHRQLQTAEAQHQQLLTTRSRLEADLQNKLNTLFIDREKCLSMRRSFPIDIPIKY